MLRVALSLLPLLAVAPAPAAELDGLQLSQVIVRERIIVRIPRVAGVPPAMPRPVMLVEKKGPKCVPLDKLRGAAITGADSIDLIIEGGTRYRARLDDDCPSLGFYSGFYMKRTADGMVCAKRDALRSRAGSACPIDALKLLVPRR